MKKKIKEEEEEDIKFPKVKLEKEVSKPKIKTEEIKTEIVEKPRTEIEQIIDKLDLDNTLNKKHFRQKKYNKVFYEIPHFPDFNLMADLIEFPTTPDGYKYLFTIVDLYTLEFDMEPVKTKDSSSVLDAMLKCFNRKPNYIGKPFASINTDGGSEFKSVYHKWIFDNNIYHKVSAPYRHKQQSVIESLNKQLTRIIMLYNNKVDDDNWIKILPELRIELNDHRKKLFEKTLKIYNKTNKIEFKDYKELPKFKVGDTVHFRLDYPENKDLEKQSTHNFRSGDFMWSKETRKIVKVIFMETQPYYRYVLDSKPSLSFSEYELLPAKVDYNTYKVKQIIGKKTEKKITYYLVWYKGELKKDASWQPKQQLLEDGLDDYIDDFEEFDRKKKKTEREKFQQKQQEKYLKEFEKEEQKKQQNKKANEIINTATTSRYNLRSRK